MRMDRGGKVAQFWDVPEDAAAHDAYFSMKVPA